MGIIIYLTLAQRGKRIGGDWSLFYAIPMIYRRNDDCFSPVLFFIYLFSLRPSLISPLPVFIFWTCARISRLGLEQNVKRIGVGACTRGRLCCVGRYGNYTRMPVRASETATYTGLLNLFQNAFGPAGKRRRFCAYHRS